MPLTQDTKEVLYDENLPIDEATGLPQEIVDAIIAASNFYEEEDRPLREVMIGFWKKLENYFNGIQRIFWDFGVRDWKRVDIDQNQLDPNLYDKIINIYRAHGESIISALSIKLPSAIFYPDDADVIEDVETAKACSKIKTLIEKHNDGILIFIKSIFILFNCGVVAAYIYNRKKSDYGTIKVPTMGKDVTVSNLNLNCSNCGNNIQQSEFKDASPEIIQNSIPQFLTCPNCGVEAEPVPELTEELIPQIVGYTDEPKSRTMIEVFSPLYVYMPFYARKQELMPYLRLKFEQHFALLKNNYPKLAKLNKIPRGGSHDVTGKYARSYSYIYDTDNQNLVTTDCIWLRPWAFECLDDEELVKKLKAQFPDGCYAVIIKGVVAEAYNESLDEHWQISHHPLSHHLHADPIGKPLAPVQELKNETTDLAIDTFEHSIPETFADAEVLDFAKYGKAQALPGMVYPVKKPISGGSIGDSFYALKTATLNEEIDSFNRRLDSDGQFVIGSFPSIYGGPAVSGSKTAKEYTESRAMALQRLNTTWTMLKYWWAKVIGRAVPIYIKGMRSDEKYVEKSTKSETGFVNVWIKQTELQGKLGSVEADAEEDLPVSSGQLKDVLVQLMTLNNDFVNEALYHPQNTPLISKALGAPEFYIPGQDDRDKQFAEFAELLKSGPIGQEPTVPVNPIVDNHIVEAETCRSFLVSPTGLATKRINPMGYANIEAHFVQHSMLSQPTQPDQETAIPEGE